jgi:hypothetical protein
MTEPCGTLVEDLAAGAIADACMIAPFIKLGALTRVVAILPASVRLTVITRWRPEEIAAGVSDLEVWNLVQARPNSELRLCHELHAKLYRFDDRCAVGSANLTDAGLGWSKSPNLELLVAMPATGPAVDLEREALFRSAPATREIYEAMLAVAKQLEKIQAVPEVVLPPELAPVRFADWLPRTRFPEMVERAYRGEWGKLTAASQEAAAFDLAALQLPHGLDHELFKAYVGALLMTHPVVQAIDGYLTRPRRFGEVRRFLAGRAEVRACGREAGEVWQVLMRWIQLYSRLRVSSNHYGFSEVVAGIRS